MAMAPFLSGVKIMTDLRKGIIEINGVEIDANTTSIDIKNKLSDLYAHCAVSKDGSVEIFRFENIKLYDRCFKIKLNFINQKLKNIELFAYNTNNLSYEDRFVEECNWLENFLGKPHKLLNYISSYYYDKIHIYAFIERELSRNPADIHISCSYEG